MVNLNDRSLGPRRQFVVFVFSVSEGLEIHKHSGGSGCFWVHLQQLMWVTSHTAFFVPPSRSHVQAKCILHADVTYPLEVAS